MNLGVEVFLTQMPKTHQARGSDEICRCTAHLATYCSIKEVIPA